MWLIERVWDSSKCEIKSTTNIYNKHLNIEIKNTTNHTNIQQLFVRCSGYINGVFIVFNWCRRWIFIAILLFWTGLMYVKEVYSSMYNVSAPKMMYRLMHRSRSYHGWCMRVYERECRRRRRRVNLNAKAGGRRQSSRHGHARKCKRWECKRCRFPFEEPISYSRKSMMHHCYFKTHCGHLRGSTRGYEEPAAPVFGGGNEAVTVNVALSV